MSSIIPSSGVSWGFTASDIFSNSTAMVTSVAAFIVLIIAVKFAPKFIGFIKGIFGGPKDGGYTQDTKQAHGDTWHYQYTDKGGRDWYKTDKGSWDKF